MLANNIEECLIRKALLVRARDFRRVDAREDRGLTGSALRTAFYPEAGVGRDQMTAKWYLRSFIGKNCEGCGVNQSVERIVWTARADAETVDEEEQEARIICHSPGRTAARERDNRSTCYGAFSS